MAETVAILRAGSDRSGGFRPGATALISPPVAAARLQPTSDAVQMQVAMATDAGRLRCRAGIRGFGRRAVCRRLGCLFPERSGKVGRRRPPCPGDVCINQDTVQEQRVRKQPASRCPLPLFEFGTGDAVQLERCAETCNQDFCQD